MKRKFRNGTEYELASGITVHGIDKIDKFYFILSLNSVI